MRDMLVIHIAVNPIDRISASKPQHLLNYADFQKLDGHHTPLAVPHPPAAGACRMPISNGNLASWGGQAQRTQRWPVGSELPHKAAVIPGAAELSVARVYIRCAPAHSDISVGTHIPAGLHLGKLPGATPCYSLHK